MSLDDILNQELASFMNPEQEEFTYTNQAVIPEQPITPDVIQALRQNPPYIQEMLQKIQDMDIYAQNRGTMGLDWGFQCLNEAFNGLNPGLHLVAGGANTGKSAFLLEVSRRVTEKNQFQTEDHPKKAYCMYFSLDDSINELMPRMIASSQRITINQALFPKTLEGKSIIKEKRERGIQALRENAEFFSMHDATEGQTVQYIEAILAKRHQELELISPDEYQIVVFIDNFHDIMVDDSVRGLTEDNARFDFISGRLNELAITYNVPIICSAEFRKISTMKRPAEDDIKSTGKITYESKGTILVYNEVGIKGENANIYWNLGSADGQGEDRKMPVFEMHISKNKFSSYKGRKFLKFIPEMATFMEASDEEELTFQQMMRG